MPVHPEVRRRKQPAGGGRAHRGRGGHRGPLRAGLGHHLYGRGDAGAGRLRRGGKDTGRGRGRRAGVRDQHGAVRYQGLRGGRTGLCPQAGELLPVLHQALTGCSAGAAPPGRAGRFTAGRRRDAGALYWRHLLSRDP